MMDKVKTGMAGLGCKQGCDDVIHVTNPIG